MFTCPQSVLLTSIAYILILPSHLHLVFSHNFFFSGFLIKILYFSLFPCIPPYLPEYKVSPYHNLQFTGKYHVHSSHCATHTFQQEDFLLKDAFSSLLLGKIHWHFSPSFSCYATRYLLVTDRALVGQWWSQYMGHLVQYYPTNSKRNNIVETNVRGEK